jgi:hypothetical protein
MMLQFGQTGIWKFSLQVAGKDFVKWSDKRFTWAVALIARNQLQWAE